jgi:hypothetical protein
MRDGVDVTLVAVLLVACGFLGAMCVAGQKDESERLCRHTIQRHFGKSSDEAKALMSETKAWESQ